MFVRFLVYYTRCTLKKLRKEIKLGKWEYFEERVG